MGLPVLTRPTDRSSTSAWRRLAALAGALVVALGVAAPAHADNPVTPGNFTGYGFDQCLAPNQAAMNAWWSYSPFTAVGIYISGDSRACTKQPNLTPTWVTTQLRNGWRLLPITLGPQASCTTRPRYLKQVRINPTPTNVYAAARAQGKAEANKTVAAAKALGIAKGSTLWYDLEAFSTKNTPCRNSALIFLSGWTQQMRALGYVSGVYSSAASGIKIVSDAYRSKLYGFTAPDRLWIADWNGRADTRTTYIPDSVWAKHQRVHQFRGGHNEKWGGVTINIDTNFLDLGLGSVAPAAPQHCGGVQVSSTVYFPLGPGTTRKTGTRMLQCLLKEAGVYTGAVSGTYDAATAAGVRAWYARVKLPARNDWTRAGWVSLLSAGNNRIIKLGSAGEDVRRAQRALNAAGITRRAVTGVADGATVAGVKAFQKRIRYPQIGVITGATWTALRQGRS